MKSQGVFIGLGGAGVCAAAHLKARMLAACQRNKQELNNQCRFIFVDTDTHAYEKMNTLYANAFANRKLIDDDWVPFSYVNPLSLFRRAQNRQELGNLNDEDRILLSFVDEKDAASFKNLRLEKGASANRQQGRVALLAEWKQLQTKISSSIEALKNPHNSQQSALSIPFYILSGTCGGTGSSLFLDVAYLLNRTVKNQFNGREPMVTAVLFMPEWYIQQYRKESNDDTVWKYQSNAYAFFEELNYFLTDYHSGEDGDKGRKFGKLFVAPTVDLQVDRLNQKWPVFNFAICIDSTSEQESKFDDDQMYQNTAEMLFHWHQSEVQGPFISSFDNQLQDQYLGKKQVPAFITMGYRALQFPRELLKEYATVRFLYEFFKYGLHAENGGGAREYLQAPEGTRWLQDILQNTVERNLPGVQEVSCQELIANARNAIGSGVFEFTYVGVANSFRISLQKRLRSFRGHINTSYEASKVGDASSLEHFITVAEQHIGDVNTRLQSEFLAADGETSLTQRVARISASIEQTLESCILAFGLTGAEITGNQLQEALKDLATTRRSEQQQHTDQLREMETRIREAQEQCQKKQDDTYLTALRNLLQEKLVISSSLTLIRQQLEVLETTAGENGVLDRYIRKLVAMKVAVQNHLRLPASGEHENTIEELYKTVLPRRFSSMRNTVTTAFLPDVSHFVNGTKYDSNHPFARSYEQFVVPSLNLNGESAPLRQSSSQVWHKPSGLHALMLEMFQSVPADVDGFNQSTSLFRQYLSGTISDVQQVVRDVDATAREKISRLTEEKILDQNRSLADSFNDLPAMEKEAIKENFINRIETFCRMDDGVRSKPLDVSLYVGQGLDLATSLGYSKGSGSHFAESTDPHRFLHIKAKALWTIDQYPFYDQYRLIYQNQVKKRNNGNQIFFSPHIHNLFNKLGVESGMRRLLNPRLNVDIYILILLYDRMFRIAQQNYFPLFKDIVYWNAARHGDLATQVSPLEQTTLSDRSTEVRIVEEVKVIEGKLQFQKDKFVLVVSSFRNYKQLFDSVERDFPLILPKLQVIDDLFQQNCSREWGMDGGPLQQAYAYLDAELAQPLEENVTGDFVSWYGTIRTRLGEIQEDLSTVTRRSRKSIKPYKGSSDDESEPDLRRFANLTNSKDLTS